MATVNQCFVCNWLFEFRLCTIVHPLNLSIPIRFFPLFPSLCIVPQRVLFPFILPLDARSDGYSKLFEINFSRAGIFHFSDRELL